jgi:Domain of unknown function (DUF4349)
VANRCGGRPVLFLPGRSGRAEEAVAVMRMSRRGAVLTVVGVLAAVLVAAVALGAAQTGGSSSTIAVAPETASGAGGGAAMDAAPPDSARQSAPGAPTQVATPLEVGRSLVRTAQVAVEIDDPAAGTGRVRTVTAALGGSVAEEYSTDSSSRLTLRVPAPSLDKLIDAIAGLGHVTSRSGQVVDATDQVVDLNARVASQQASVVRVRALLGRATTIGDIVSIEAELSRREADLDSLTGRLAALRDQVALSTLTVEISKPGVTVEPPVAAGFVSGLVAGWDGLRAVASAVGVAAGFLSPFLAVLAVLGGIAWLGRRMIRSRRAPAAGNPSGSAGGT